MTKNLLALAFVLLVSAPAFADEVLKLYPECTQHFPPCPHMTFSDGKKALQVIRVNHSPAMTLGPNDVKSAEKVVDAQNNSKLLMLHLNDDAAKKFASLTKSIIKKRLAIVLDGKVLTAPVVQTEITGGNLQLSAGTDNNFNYLDKIEWLKKLTETPAAK